MPSPPMGIDLVYLAVGQGILQIAEFKGHIRVFPSGFKFPSDIVHLIILLLGFQTLHESEKGSRISRVLPQVGAKHRFCSLCLTVLQQSCPKRFPHWIKPLRRFAVIQSVFQFDRFLPMLDGLLMIALGSGDAGI